MNDKFLVLLAGKGPELDEKIILGCNTCSSKCTDACIKEEIKELITSMKQLFVVQELGLTVRIPLLIEGYRDANQFILSQLKSNSVAILVSLEKDKAFIYKGPDKEVVKKLLLPPFFCLYAWVYDECEPCLESIEDISDCPPQIEVDPVLN
ncbi:TPA: hypothetical protein DIC40_02590 [Patescibacteria group bacterium]|nr:hypothetical protein P148_SR1C00001G0204 [candidate division SR1 bacterium RAAC1_SR1_1]HCY20738.1 hypothetical protein [Candidatus Gracilibacteria bacterium]